MYRARSPQTSLLETSNLVPPAKAKRLRTSWAEPFRRDALPLIDEGAFASLYCADHGRPNRPVQTVLGVLLLKEMHGLTDAAALEHLEFDLQWHHALALTPEEAHLPQKTLHNFRARLMEHDRGWQAFAEITDRIRQALGSQVSRQRLDSTHVMSNIAVLTRLGLFCETIRHFLKQLASKHPRLSAQVPERLRRRYLKEDGRATAYQDAPSGQGPRRLPVCARDVYRLHQQFAGTSAEGLEAYALLRRLLAEQCDMTPQPERPSTEDDDAGEGGAPVAPKAAEQVGSDTLQSPHDADATYGRKGKGYEVQIAETCVEAPAEAEAPNETEAEDLSTVNLITHVEVTDACASDEHATMPVLEALDRRGHRPDELVADTAYGSGDNAVAAEQMGTEVVSPVKGPPVEVEPEPETVTRTHFEVKADLEDPAICPAGHLAREQSPCEGRPHRATLTFEPDHCESCELLSLCPVTLNRAKDGYVVTVNLKAINLARRRRAQARGAFRPRYRIRAGIEATVSELKRKHGLGALRVRGRWRVELAVHLKALACNLKRFVRALVPGGGAPSPAKG